MSSPFVSFIAQTDFGLPSEQIRFLCDSCLISVRCLFGYSLALSERTTNSRREGAGQLVRLQPHPAPRTRPLGGKNDCIKGLILRTGGDMLFSQMGQKPFQLLFTRQMKRKPFEVVAISPEPGAVSPLSGERKMLPPKHFRESAHCFIGVHTAILIHGPPVGY